MVTLAWLIVGLVVLDFALYCRDGDKKPSSVSGFCGILGWILAVVVLVRSLRGEL